MRVAVLGIDLGDHCGWATVDLFRDHKGHSTGFVFRHGVWQFKPTRFDSASTRYDKFERQLSAEIASGITHVAYEAVHAHQGTAAAHVYGGYMHTLMRVCDKYSVPCQHYAVGTIKKAATGHGGASKDAMKRAASILVGSPIEDDNEADAIHIAHMHFGNIA